MKKLLILSTILFLGALNTSAQLFSDVDHPVFRDIDSTEYKLALAGGLNQPQFSQIDLNSDGKLDLFIFDRSGNTRLCFIAVVKNGSVQYVHDPDFEHLIPQGRDFTFLRDYNNDGKPDVWTYGYHTQKLELYKNVHNTAPAFQYDWKMRAYNYDNPPFDTSDFNMFTGNLPDVVDLNQDGDMDVVTNIAYCGSNLTYYRNRAIEDGIGFNSLEFDIPDYCLGNLKENLATNTILLDQPCDLGGRYYKKKKHCGVKTLGFFDNDGDGDLDLFFGTSEQLTNPLYYIENGKADFSMSIDTFISIDTAYFSNSIEAMIPVAAATSFVDFDLDGIKDLIISTNESISNLYEVRQVNNVIAFKNHGTNADPDFQFVRRDYLVGDMIDFGSHTAPCFADIDGDDDFDLFIGTNGDDFSLGDSSFHLVFFENVGSKTAPEFILRDTNFLDLRSRKLTFIAPCFTDIDGDDDLDLFYGKTNGTITLFENTGTKSSASFNFSTDDYNNIWVGEQATPYFYDLNSDGLLDLLVGEYDGNINYYENNGSSSNANFVLENDSLGGMRTNELIPKTIYVPVKKDTLVYSFFGNSSLRIGTLGNQGKNYVIAGGADGTLRVFEIPDDITQDFIQDSAQQINSITNSMYIRDFGGLVYPAVADLNNDGYSDVILGNNRGGIHFLSGRSTLSIGEKAKLPKVQLYPNPTSSVIHVRLNSVYDEFNYSIKDLRGREVQSGTNVMQRNILLNNELANGVYFIQVTAANVDYSPSKFVLIRD